MSDLRIVREYRSDLLAAVPARRRRHATGRAVAVAFAVLVLGLAIGTIATGSFPLEDLLPTWLTQDDKRELGAPVAASARIPRIRAPDPEGGAPWGVRILRTARGATCEQPGRVAAGRFGYLADDGRFREAPLSLFGCSPRAVGGGAGRTPADVSDGPSSIGFAPASGAPVGGYSHHPCAGRPLTVPESFDPQVIVCDGRPLRWVVQGTVGVSDVTAIEVRGSESRTRYPIVDGRYMIVRRNEPGPSTAFAVFRDGRRKELWGIGRRPVIRRDHAAARRAAVRAAPPTVGRAGLVGVSLRTTRAPGGAIGDGFDVTLRGPRGCAHQQRISFTVLRPRNAVRGARVRFGIRPPALNGESPRAWCRGHYSGRVVLGGALLGRFGFRVR